MSLNDLWKTTPAAEVKKKTFDLLPKGRYVATVTNCVLDSTSTGKDCIKWEFTISTGEYKGRKIWDMRTITEKTIPWVKSEFKSLGLEPQSVDEIPVALAQVYDRDVEIYVTVKEAEGQYPAKNRAAINGFAKQETTSNEDDIPFGK